MFGWHATIWHASMAHVCGGREGRGGKGVGVRWWGETAHCTRHHHQPPGLRRFSRQGGRTSCSRARYLDLYGSSSSSMIDDRRANSRLAASKASRAPSAMGLGKADVAWFQVGCGGGLWFLATSNPSEPFPCLTLVKAASPVPATITIALRLGFSSACGGSVIHRANHHGGYLV